MAETAGLVELDCLARIEDRLRFRHPPAAVPSRQIGAARARYRLGKALQSRRTRNPLFRRWHNLLIPIERLTQRPVDESRSV
jgi:hypothetical protein